MEKKVFNFKRKKVHSPYFPENNYVNPNFPFGLDQRSSEMILKRSNPLIINRQDGFKKTKSEKEALKKAKREAMPFSNIAITV